MGAVYSFPWGAEHKRFNYSCTGIRFLSIEYCHLRTGRVMLKKRDVQNCIWVLSDGMCVSLSLNVCLSVSGGFVNVHQN